MIVVGVAIETAKQIKTQVQEQEYRGLWTNTVEKTLCV